MKITALSLCLLFLQAEAVACYMPPSEIMQSPDVLVSNAEVIVLGKVIGANPLKSIPKVTSSSTATVSYIIEVVEVLKGKSPPKFTIRGITSEGNGYVIDSSRNHHQNFGLDGSSAVTADCQRSLPSFILGANYLIFLGGRPDTKDFERIDSDADVWLFQVRNLVVDSKKK